MKLAVALALLGAVLTLGVGCHHHASHAAHDGHKEAEVHAHEQGAGHSHTGMEWYHGRLTYDDEALVDWVPPQITRALDHHHDHADCPCHDPSDEGFHFATDHDSTLASASMKTRESIAIAGCCAH